MNDTKAQYMGEEANKLLTKLMEVLKEHLGEYASEADLFASLMASQMVVEAISTRLKNMDTEESLIELAVENAKNQIVFMLQENDGKFIMHGEEV